MHGGFGVGRFGESEFKSLGGFGFTMFEFGRFGGFGWLAGFGGLGGFGAFAGFAEFGGDCVLKEFEAADVLGGLGNSAGSEGFSGAKLEGEVETGRSSSGSLRVSRPRSPRARDESFSVRTVSKSTLEPPARPSNLPLLVAPETLPESSAVLASVSFCSLPKPFSADSFLKAGSPSLVFFALY